MHKRKTTAATEAQALLLTVPQAATLLNVGRSTVYELIAKGELPSVSVSKRSLRVRKAALEAWIASRETLQGA